MTTTRPEVTFREPLDVSFSQSIVTQGDTIAYTSLTCSGCVEPSPDGTWTSLALGVITLVLGAVLFIIVVRKTLFT